MDITKPDRTTVGPRTLRVLMLEDTPREARLMASVLEQGGFSLQLEVTDSADSFRECLEKADYDVTLADCSFQSSTAFDALEILKQSGRDIPLIVITGAQADGAAAEYIQRGAADFVQKDRPARLPTVVHRVLEEKRLSTENKRAEGALNEERHLLHTLMDNLPDLIYFKDRDSRFTRVNLALAKKLHLDDPAQAVGRTDFDFLPAEHAEAFHKDDAELLRTGRFVVGKEEKGIWPDGQLTWVSTTKIPLRDANGNGIGICGVSRDITERNQAEEALRQVHENLRCFVDANILGIITANLSGGVIEANDYYLRTIGYTRQELEQGLADWRAATPPEWLPATDHAIAELRERGTSTPYEKEYVRRDGTRVWVLISDVMLPGPEERIASFVLDISERKRGEVELRRVNRALRTISACNQVIVRAAEESHLLEDVCWILVREGGYRMAWVGYGEHDEGKSVRPVAHAGLEAGYLQTLRITWADTERGRGPMGTAIRTGKPVIAGNVQTKPSIALWREELLKRGYASIIALPIFLNGQVLGALTIYAEETNVFDSEEVQLLTELSNDLAYGIQALRTTAERERAREELNEERHLLHTLMDNLPDMIYFKDRESCFTRINLALANKLRLDQPAQAVGKTDFDFFSAGHAKVFYDDEKKIIRTGQPMLGKEETVAWPDGQVAWDSTTKMPLRDANGNIIGTFGVSRDITERKRAEESLRASEERFRTTFENAGIGMAVVDMQGHPIKLNPALQQMLGYSEQELSRMAFPEFTHPDDRDLDWGLFREVVAGKRDQYEIEKRFLKKHGGVLWGLLTVSLIKGGRGAPEYCVAMVQDITDRTRAEDALRASEERYRELVENAQDIVYTQDLDGNFTSLNRAGEELTGYLRSEILRLNMIQVLAPESLGPAREEIRRLLAGEKPVPVRLEWVRKDGRRLAVEVAARILQREGKPVGIEGMARDITGRLQLEQQLRQAQRMEALGRLAGGVAHDFNNLLTIINGYAQILTRRSSPDDPHQGLFDEILTAGERAATLTRQLLAFSRRQVLEPRVLDLSSVLANTEKMLRRLIGEDVELVTTLKPDLGRVKVDPGQMEQVVMNLAVNARDAMPQGGKFLIETCNVEVDEEYARSHSPMMPGKYVMLAVSDTGCGMDLETQAHIFEPFFTTKVQGQGTGLGLATVYGIIKQSGGFIWVYSEPGQGATFKIYFPCVEEALPAAESKLRRPTRHTKGKETVLVVEDEKGVRSLVCEVLRSNGYTTLQAEGASEALKIAEKHRKPIHLLLTDVVMPHIGGKELAQRLSTLHPESKVLYISGYTDDAIIRSGISGGRTPFLQKPFLPDALLLKVRDVLKKKRVPQ
jgi:PAS domain S-box-containing protein